MLYFQGVYVCLCVRELREKTSFKSIVVRKSLLEVWQSIHLVHPKLRGSLVCGPSRVADPWFCCGYANAAMQKSDLERLLGRVDQLRSCVVKQLETPATNWNETSHSFHVVSEQIMAATDSLVSNVRDESSDQLRVSTDRASLRRQLLKLSKTPPRNFPLTTALWTGQHSVDQRYAESHPGGPYQEGTRESFNDMMTQCEEFFTETKDNIDWG